MVLSDPPPQAAKRALLLFGIAHMLLAVDRWIMAIKIEQIKHEFALRDTQLGLLTGLGFALFFGIARLPLGWLVSDFYR